jgi:hypothetical protein
MHLELAEFLRVREYDEVEIVCLCKYLRDFKSVLAKPAAGGTDIILTSSCTASGNISSIQSPDVRRGWS